MKEEEIDKLNEDLCVMLEGGDQQAIHQFYEKYSGIKLPEVIEDDDVMKAGKAIMMRIENGDYDYFWQLITNNHRELIKLMQYSSKTDDIKWLIENREKIGLDSYTVKDLIIATQNPTYIKSCIEDREKFGILYSKPVKDLIKATQDTVYIKKCIEDREQLRLNLFAVIELIQETQDPAYIKSCIENRGKLGISSYDVKGLIKATQDIDYIKSCIENRGKLGLDPYDVRELIAATQNLDYIKSCIEDREKIGLSSNAVNELIKTTQNLDFIKVCIEDREKLGLDSNAVIELIQGIQDIDYIKSCIEDRKKIGLDSNAVIKFIQETQDTDYIKSCIEDREKLGLDSNAVKELIQETQDTDYIKSCIKDREKLELDASATVELILLTGDLEYIAECEKKINLKQADIEKLRVFTKKVNIDLPQEMTIGVEIETEGQEKDNSKIIEKYLSEKAWIVKEDGSLENGAEVVSPILTGNPLNSSNEIRRVCAVLNGVSQTTSERCGGHIHIGADYLTSKQDWLNLIQIWANAEKVLYIIGNEVGSIPRKGVLKHAQPISKKVEDAIQFGTINLEGEEDLSQFVRELSEVQGNRYSGINFNNVGNNEKNTIEFRLPNGTINPNTWLENINLFGGIVRSSHELSAIQEKIEEERTEEERKMLDSFEMIQKGQDEEQIEKALIELCITPESRQIYMDRYTVNKPLLESHFEIKDAITGQISTNKIGEKVFKGKDRVNGVDYEQSALFLEELARREITQGIEQGE